MGGRKDLKRFRVYEAMASYQHDVEVTTYVLFSGNIKRPMTGFTEGINTFCIVPITMNSYNADFLIAELQRKKGCGEELEKDELVLLPLCLLMDGEMALKDRVKAAYQITQEVETIDRQEIDRIEIVLYVMADKFLDVADMDELMEVFGMTRLGQKLVDKGVEEGKVEERLKIAESLIGVLDEEMIAEKTSLPFETVMMIKEKMMSVSVS